MKTYNNNSWNGFTHHALVAKARVTTSIAKRDLEFISDFGVNEERLSNFEIKINNLEAIPTYSIQKAEQVFKTEEKDEAKKSLIKRFKTTRQRFSMIFPVGSKAYSQFMVGNIEQMKLKYLMSYSELFISGLKSNKTDLASVGITDEYIAQLETEIADFKVLAKAYTQFMKENDTKTSLRYKAMQEVYDELVFVSKAGRTLWKYEDTTKYKDYLITETKRTKTIEEESSTSEHDEVLSNIVNSLS